MRDKKALRERHASLNRQLNHFVDHLPPTHLSIHASIRLLAPTSLMFPSGSRHTGTRGIANIGHAITAKQQGHAANDSERGPEHDHDPWAECLNNVVIIFGRYR